MSTDETTDPTVGVAVIATMLGVSRQRADVLSRQKGFPDPVGEGRLGRKWLRSDVVAYQAARTTPTEETAP